MPLKCLDGEQEVYSFDVTSDDEWAALRAENIKKKSLRMPCCGAGVVLRTSKLGTRHFAHAKRGPCVTAPETAEHLLAKMIVLKAIQETVWEAKPEQSGKTPAGNEWRADVLATKGNARVAFEIQWSRQDNQETARRQQRYADARVRGLWLFRQKDFPTSKETPAFRLVFLEDTKSFEVLMPSSQYDQRWVAHVRDASRMWGQQIPLERFVVGALSGRLHFSPAIGQRMPVEVETVQIPCWKCKKNTGIVMGLVFAVSRVFIGCPDISISIYELEEFIPEWGTELVSILTPELLKKHGIGTVKPRGSKTQGREYISNGCIHCDALQGQFFEHEYAYEAETTFETEAELKAEWIHGLSHLQPLVCRWWFDET